MSCCFFNLLLLREGSVNFSFFLNGDKIFDLDLTRPETSKYFFCSVCSYLAILNANKVMIFEDKFQRIRVKE